MKTFTNKLVKNVKNKSLAIYCSLAAGSANAGGLDAGTDALNDFTDQFYTFVGVGAGLYMLVQCAMAWGDRKSWEDAGMACGKVAVAGGALALAKFCWGIFA